LRKKLIFVYNWQEMLIIIFFIIVTDYFMPISEFTLTLQWSKLIAPGVKHFAFSREDAQPFSYIPGQFITLFLPQPDKLLRRSYSIATIPGESEWVEFSASYIADGRASELLFNLTPGTTLSATGPHGRLILRDEQPARYILVGTGTGITPYRAMLPELAKRMSQSDLQVILLLGVRDCEYCLYADDFTHFAKAHPAFTFRAQYSRTTAPLDATFEFSGHVQSAFPELNLNPEGDIVYLCGNPAMIDSAFAALKGLGFDTQSVRREKYFSSN
jgi:ferredoxin-NADP reductase